MRHDDLDPARGIINACIISSCLWLGVAAILYWVL